MKAVEGFYLIYEFGNDLHILGPKIEIIYVGEFKATRVLMYKSSASDFP